MTARTIAPVEKSVTVRRSAEDAFRIFTEQLGDWWPLDRHAVDPGRARSARITPDVGGAVVEVWDDGQERPWGRIVSWDPPRGFTMTWNPSGGPETEVSVSFTSEGDGTRVVLVHRGWERLGERADETRDAYDGGWPGVLDRYAAAT